MNPKHRQDMKDKFLKSVGVKTNDLMKVQGCSTNSEWEREV